MSVFLTPDLSPVTGGTYFPPVDKYGQPGFKSVLTTIAHKVPLLVESAFCILWCFVHFQWIENKSEVLGSGRRILEALKSSVESEGLPKVGLLQYGANLECILVKFMYIL